MIEVEHLTKRYGQRTVLDDVSFSIAPGQSVALWGPNGAGKTTIVRCLLGLSRFEGRIAVGGKDVVRDGKAVRRSIGHVPQELAFYEDLTVDETVSFSSELRGVPEARRKEVLALAGLEAEGAKRVGALSGGMKQRLALSVALLDDPAILILDEPTSNLDIGARERVVELLESLRSPDRILLLTSHRLEEVGMLVQRVISLEDGRVTMECPPGDLAERLSLRSWLHVVVGGGDTTRAIGVLVDSGFDARRNTHGIIVEVSANRKGDALSALQDHDIGIVDLEVWR